MALLHVNASTVVCISALLALQYHYFSQVVGHYKVILQNQYSDYQIMRLESLRGQVEKCTHSNQTNSIVEAEQQVTRIDDIFLFLPSCDNSTRSQWIECAPVETTIDVILTVYKRNNLLQQLNMIAAQTLLPSNIWVIHNEDHQDIEPIIQAWNYDRSNLSNYTLFSNMTQSWPDHRPPLNWLQFHSDSKYHGRFHVAYMMSSAKYVSIWDDDLSVGAGWLDHVVAFLISQNDTALVSGKGRIVQQLPRTTNDYEVIYLDREKLVREPVVWMGGTAHSVDFTVQHHTLRRDFLRFYLGAPVYTYETGEDIQLNFALQKQGILSYSLARHQNVSRDAWASADNGMGSNGPHASWKQKPQEPRLWLLCKLVKEGYRLPNCQNCNNSTIVQECLDHFEKTGNTMRHRRRRYRERQRSEQEMTIREIALQYIRQQ